MGLCNSKFSFTGEIKKSFRRSREGDDEILFLSGMNRKGERLDIIKRVHRGR